MKRNIASLIFAFAVALILTSQVWAEQADSSKMNSDSSYYIIETRHRLYPEFSQVDTVGMDQPFYIGEEEYEGVVVGFNPHLGITTKGEALQLSDTLYNPAVRVHLSLEGELKQENWGFFIIESPHFRRDDLLAFKLVDFKVSDKYITAPAGK